MPRQTAAWFNALFPPRAPASPPPATETARREGLIDAYLEETARAASTRRATYLQETARGHRVPPVCHALIEILNPAAETAMQLAAYQRQLAKLQAQGRYIGGTELQPVQEGCREGR